jgi:hypothetical protein
MLESTQSLSNRPEQFKSAEFDRAVKEHADKWVPACSGTEEPFKSRSGRRLLYCYNPKLDRHAYLDCETDLILTDEEAHAALAI